MRLLHEPIDAYQAQADFAARHSGSGAIASFLGNVRDDGGTQALELKHYEPLTLPAMRGLADTARARFGLNGVLILHRTGVLKPGEAIVLVVAAAAHRRAALAAVDYMMDHLKAASWFWKREQRSDGSQWIEPREEDHTGLSRWD